MRSPVPPSASINLGDDADPASELGQRLAATAQTAQGLLTNYLFYGQRRQAEAQHGERTQRRGDGESDGRHEATRGTEETHASRGDAVRQARLPQPPGSSPAAASPLAPETPRLHLRLVHTDDHHASDDLLAHDALAARPRADALSSDGLVEGTEPVATGGPDLSNDPRERR